MRNITIVFPKDIDFATTGTSAEFGGKSVFSKRNIDITFLDPPSPIVKIPRKRNIEIIGLDDHTQKDRNNSIKGLEGKTFPTEAALFDALAAAGISTLGDYRSGGHNKDIARKEAGRYIEYKLTQEIDSTCKAKRQCTIIKVYDTAKTKADKRGKSGRYIIHLKPLIVQCDTFQGTKAEFFDRCGMYDSYKGIGIVTESSYAFDPWKISRNALPGDEAYRRAMSYQEKECLDRALDSLQKEGALTWEKVLKYTPRIETDGENNSVFRLQTYQEWEGIQQNRFLLIQQIAEDEGCVLNPELYVATFEPDMYERYKRDYYVNGKKPGVYTATPAQQAWYENYCQFLRQLAVTLCDKQETYIAPENLPELHEFWTSPKYRKRYVELDKVLRERLLGWGSVWKSYEYEIIDHQKAEQYEAENVFERVEALRKEFINYMDERMGRIALDVNDPKLKEDFTGVGRPTRWTLSYSVSATSLHEKVKKAHYEVSLEKLISSEAEETT